MSVGELPAAGLLEARGLLLEQVLLDLPEHRIPQRASLAQAAEEAEIVALGAQAETVVLEELRQAEAALGLRIAAAAELVALAVAERSSW